jgi:hypothetical protein
LTRVTQTGAPLAAVCDWAAAWGCPGSCGAAVWAVASAATAGDSAAVPTAAASATSATISRVALAIRTGFKRPFGASTSLGLGQDHFGAPAAPVLPPG